jgi:restriction system protein
MKPDSHSYYRIMLGKGSVFAPQCFEGGFIGTDFDINMDLTGRLPGQWRAFNKEFIPVFLEANPDKTKIGAGLACGALWTVSKGVLRGDLVLSPDGTGTYQVGRVVSDYFYAEGEVLPHHRKVEWLGVGIPRAALSDQLRNSAGSVGTVSNVTAYAEEIERLINIEELELSPALVASDPDVEDPVSFALEKHLEDFLVKNWGQTMLGNDYSIFEEDGEVVGQQYATDAGPIDILAVSRDNSRILVLELKRGRASDVVVGQTLRYMGYLMDQVASDGQTVEGIIIALEDDQKLRWALQAVPNVRFFRYRVDFHLTET